MADIPASMKIVVTPTEYRIFLEQGFDMRYYVENKLIDERLSPPQESSL